MMKIMEFSVVETLSECTGSFNILNNHPQLHPAARRSQLGGEKRSFVIVCYCVKGATSKVTRAGPQMFFVRMCKMNGFKGPQGNILRESCNVHSLI
jgi:hypothetical protein